MNPAFSRPVRRSLLLTLVAAILPLVAPAAEKPNFLLIIGDDCTYNDLPLYGGNNPYWATWMSDDPMGGANAYEHIKRYMRRPAEQPYHTLRDPYEMENLANDQGYRDVGRKLGEALDAWMQAEGDPGAPAPTGAHPAPIAEG